MVSYGMEGAGGKRAPGFLDMSIPSLVPEPDPSSRCCSQDSLSPSQARGSAPHQQPKVFAWCHCCVPRKRGVTVALNLLPLLFPGHLVWSQSGIHQFFLLSDNNKCVFSFSIK